MADPFPVRWGVLAPGRIAASFVRDLAHVPGASVTAVGSRSASRSEAFVAEHAAGARAHASYAALVADPEVDVVYVASPHSLHAEHTVLALSAGKHVLCEKPFAMTLGEAEGMVRAAQADDRFLMEAMWTACHPVVRALVDGLAAGRFGTPKQLHADLGWRVELPDDDRLVDPALGAGALLDLGVYPLALADLLLGPAEQVAATAVLNEAGVDVDVAMATRHAGGAVGALTASTSAYSPRTAALATDRGRLELPADFHHPPHAVWLPHDGDPETITGTEPLLGTGLGNEALEVARCLAEGRRESTLVPHELTLRLATLMDEVRRQAGVRYAADT